MNSNPIDGYHFLKLKLVNIDLSFERLLDLSFQRLLALSMHDPPVATLCNIGGLPNLDIFGYMREGGGVSE